MQATVSLSLPLPAMTYLSRLSRSLTASQVLLRAHAPLVRASDRERDVFAQGCCSPAGWRYLPGAPAVGPSAWATATHSLTSP